MSIRKKTAPPNDSAIIKLWNEISSCNDEIARFCAHKASAADLVRLQNFFQKWEKFIKNVSLLYSQLAETNFSSVQKIDVIFPFTDDAFIKAWEYWKEYLAEQHHVTLKSRAEQKQLERLSQLSKGDHAEAIKILEYAESTLYKNFFDVKTLSMNIKSSAKKTADDGDF